MGQQTDNRQMYVYQYVFCFVLFFYRSYPLGGVVLWESSNVQHPHHIQQVSLVKRGENTKCERKKSGNLPLGLADAQ